jgi:hypothetical protein
MMPLNQRATKLWFQKFVFAGLALLVFALTSQIASAQTNPNCPLEISGVTGDLSNFTVNNLDPTTVQISIPANTVGVWGTVVVASSVNTNVNVSPVPTGTKNPVFVTASKINANQAASFTLTAEDSVGHDITISVIVNCPVTTVGCTRTQGFWKNKPEQWAVSSLTLGTVTYTKAQLLEILSTPVRGNGLISLAHQLIAAKLNAAAGTTVPTSVQTDIMAADALIGNRVIPPIGSGFLSTSATSSLTSDLDEYNNGNTPGGPRHCD